MSFKENVWLWGQMPNSHHEEDNNLYNLPGVNKMTPREGAEFFGIDNVCLIVMEDKPSVDKFDSIAESLKDVKRVAWSVLGSGGSKRNNDGGSDLDEMLNLARKYPNIMAGVADDFMRPERMKVYTPEILNGYKDRLHNEIGKKLEFWNVIYTHEIDDNAKPYLDVFDTIKMWTWEAKDLVNLDENYKKLRGYIGEDKPLMCGCYMWDYGGHKPMPMDLMKYQLDKYYNWYEQGKIDGMIICSICIADLGLDTVEYTKNWLMEA